jgi:hypothetical protein
MFIEESYLDYKDLCWFSVLETIFGDINYIFLEWDFSFVHGIQRIMNVKMDS